MLLSLLACCAAFPLAFRCVEVPGMLDCCRRPAITGTSAARMVGDGLQTFALAALQGSSDMGAYRSSFCAALQRDSVVIVSLPPSSLPAIASMWKVLRDFDELGPAAQRVMGPLHQAPPSRHHKEQDRKVGFTGEFKNHNGWCIDTRLRRVGPDGGVKAFETMPEGLDKALPDATSALSAAQDVLHDVAMTALRVVVQASAGAQAQIEMLHLTVDGLSDAPATLPLGASSATTHRLVKYAADVTNSDAFGGRVAFAAHTDSTWF
jgi:hypothetical protein